jgi:hypothetical protein
MLGTNDFKCSHENNAMFFDITGVTEAGTVDGIHLDEDQHGLVGEAIARFVLATCHFLQ